jgi:hypothetical protein
MGSPIGSVSGDGPRDSDVDDPARPDAENDPAAPNGDGNPSLRDARLSERFSNVASGLVLFVSVVFFIPAAPAADGETDAPVFPGKLPSGRGGENGTDGTGDVILAILV